MQKSLSVLALMGCLLPSLTGCDPVTIIGAGAVVGAAASEDRGIGGIASDTEIRTRINIEWGKISQHKFADISLSVQNGRVLLTGTVASPQVQIEAVQAVWKVPGVKEVLDETKVGHPEDFGDYMRDAWMTTKMKNALLWDGHIRSLNFSIRTVDRVIYIMGVAQNQTEMDLVVEHAQTISDVRNVVNLATIKTSQPTTTPLSSSLPATPAASTAPMTPSQPIPLAPQPQPEPAAIQDTMRVPSAAPVPVSIKPL